MEIIGTSAQQGPTNDSAPTAGVQLCDLLPADQKVSRQAFEDISDQYPDMLRPSRGGEYTGDKLVCSCGAIAMVDVVYRRGAAHAPLPHQRTA